MAAYNKLWVVIIGVLLMILIPVAKKYLGIDLTSQQDVLIQAIIGVLTAAGVYQVTNKPTTSVKEDFL